MIIGQENAVQRLQKTLASGRLAQAYLFYGPKGTGKKLTALQFTKALYCPTLPAVACDTCSVCHKIALGNHPDVMVLSPEGASIKIEDIRTMQQRLSYKPYENRRTTIVIDGCEYLTPPAANALLKTLEEPPEQALLLLLTGKKDALPLTILSRCQMVPFRALAAAHICTILEQQGLDPATARIAAPLVEGSLDTWEQADITAMLAQRDTAQALLQDVVQGNGLRLFHQARQLAGKRPQCEALLRCLALLCRDLVMLKLATPTDLYNHDRRTELAPLAQACAYDHLLDTYDLIEQLRQYVPMNVNPQLLFERLMVHLQHTFTPTGPPASEAAQRSRPA
jgi:DNA polymerase-3 subunit delta'